MQASRLLLALLLCLGCGGAASGSMASAPAPRAPVLLYVVNQSAAPTAEVQTAVNAVQAQLSGEFLAAWEVQVTLVLADPPGGARRIWLVDDEPHGFGGYHDGDSAWVETSDPGWSEILSHEAIESVVGNVCDPVQRPYGDPPVENFELPNGSGYLETR